MKGASAGKESASSFVASDAATFVFTDLSGDRGEFASDAATSVPTDISGDRDEYESVWVMLPMSAARSRSDCVSPREACAGSVSVTTRDLAMPTSG